MSSIRRRRLTVYPGQISMVFNMRHAQEFFESITNGIESIPEKDRGTTRRFLAKMKSAIETGERLNEKQSAHDKKKSNTD